MVSGSFFCLQTPIISLVCQYDQLVELSRVESRRMCGVSINLSASNRDSCIWGLCSTLHLSLKEVWKYVAQFVDMSGSDTLFSTASAFEQDLQMLSFYSGCDGYAVCATALHDELKKRHFLVDGGGPHFVQASDISLAAREILLAHPAHSQAKHVFGDQTAKFDAKVCGQIEACLDHAQCTAQDMLRVGYTADYVRKTVEEEMVFGTGGTFHGGCTPIERPSSPPMA